MALGDALREGGLRHAGRRALLFEDRCWTYAELDEITDRLAASLMRAGVGAGDRVALLFTNRPEIVFSYYACFKIGAVAVPINFRLKAPEIAYILAHSGARLLLAQADIWREIRSNATGDFPHVPSVCLTDAEGDDPALGAFVPFARMLASAEPGVPFPAVSDNDMAAILYTSGTTSRPKGVNHTHYTLQQTILNCHAGMPREAGQVHALIASACHIAAFAMQLLPCLHAGATALIVPRFEPATVLDTLERHRVTHTFALPVMYSALVNCPSPSQVQLALQVCQAGGDGVAPELQRRFAERFGVELTEGCGMTEVIPYSFNPVSGLRKAGSVGPPAPGMELRLVDDAGQDVPRGENGEIWVRSEALMAGYWNDPEATAAAVRDGWFKTGDVGRVDDDGYYWFVGRKKEIIVRGGSNIGPLEVEEALMQHPAVAEVGVVGVPDATWGEAIRAYVSLKAGCSATEDDLRGFLAPLLAEYKIPDRIVFLTELPKGVTNKIHRKTLRDYASAEDEI